MTDLFRYPGKARFGRIIPKAKIYQYAKPKPAQRKQLTALVQQIRWAYKLAPETINLPSNGEVREIQVIHIKLARRDLSDEVLRMIDSAIPSAVIFELICKGHIMIKAAHKQHGVSRSGRPRLSRYFASDWVIEDAPRHDLPPALNLGILYDKILTALIAPDGDSAKAVTRSLADKVQHQEAIFDAEKTIAGLERKLKQTKQFNLQIEVNHALRKVRQDLVKLKKE